MRRLHRRHRVPIDGRVVVDMPLAMPMSAGIAQDRSQQNHDGVLGSANTWGYPGLVFEGSANSKITIGDVGDPQTLSLFFKPDGIGGNDQLFNLEGVFEAIYVGTGTIATAGLAGAVTAYVNGTASTSVTAGIWQMITLTINAPESASVMVMGVILAFVCNGRIGDVFVTDEEYSQTQIQNRFNLTKWKYGI